MNQKEDEEESKEQLILRALTICKSHASITPGQLDRRMGVNKTKAQVVYRELRKMGVVTEEQWKNSINVGIIDKRRLKEITLELLKK